MRPALSFHFITLFPETIRVWMTTSILGRAHEAGLFAFEIIQLRDYAEDRHRTVDDVAYGGGGGMVLKCGPLVAAVESIRKTPGQENAEVIYFTPTGNTLNQSLVRELSARGSDKSGHFILVCGHYEGVDQRFVDHWVDHEISLGDFVITGGELPALALADAMIRQVEGVLGYHEAPQKESFSLRDEASGSLLLEYPHYTRPSEFRGHKVPEILLSGDHGKVDRWRQEQSHSKTKRMRPDLLPASGSSHGRV